MAWNCPINSVFLSLRIGLPLLSTFLSWLCSSVLQMHIVKAKAHRQSLKLAWLVVCKNESRHLYVWLNSPTQVPYVTLLLVVWNTQNPVIFVCLVCLHCLSSNVEQSHHFIENNVGIMAKLKKVPLEKLWVTL